MKSLKSLPLRTCIGCGKKDEKSKFVMVSRPSKSSPENSLEVSAGKNKSGGRSAYICKNEECLKKARKARRLERSFKGKVSNEIYEEIERIIANNE